MLREDKDELDREFNTKISDTWFSNPVSLILLHAV